MSLSLTIHRERELCAACKKPIGANWVAEGTWNDSSDWKWWHDTCAPANPFDSFKRRPFKTSCTRGV